MAKYPNQRSVSIHSSSGRKVPRPYGIITRKELQTAIRILDNTKSVTPIILFAVFCLHHDGYLFDFSPAALEQEFGVAADRWRDAFNVLVKRGYLIPDDKNHYTFESYPLQYRDANLADETPGQEYSDGEDEFLSWLETESPSLLDFPWSVQDGVGAADMTCPTSPHGDHTPADRDSNNTYNNTLVSSSLAQHNQLDDRLSTRPEYEAVIKKQVEIDGITNALRTEFGHLESTETGLLNAKSASKDQPIGFSRVSKQLNELKDLLNSQRVKKTERLERTRSEYRIATKEIIPYGNDSGNPGNDNDIKLILEKFEQEYRTAHNGRSFPWTWGVWISGWNEELQQPNLVISRTVLPPAVLKKQQHNLDGIPEEYLEKLRVKE